MLRYIGTIDLQAARHWLDELDRQTLIIAEFPNLGTPIGKPKAKVFKKTYNLTTIIYRFTRTKVEIMRVLDSRQDVDRRSNP